MQCLMEESALIQKVFFKVIFQIYVSSDFALIFSTAYRTFAQMLEWPVRPCCQVRIILIISGSINQLIENLENTLIR